MSKRKKRKANRKSIAISLIIICIFVILMACAISQILVDNKEKGSQESNSDAAEETSSMEQHVEEAPNSIEIIQKAEASYEEWIAAAMVTAISMQYSEFEIQGIYVASETELDKKMESQGTYVAFVSGGQSLILESKPLKAERTAVGTKDLYTMDLGFATFDIVSGMPDATTMTTIELSDLETLILQSILVSIYER